MQEKILEKLGFTKGEKKVYLALLKLGNTTTGQIVKESKISKSKVYDILERLSIKGVISETIEEKIKHFQAANPKRLQRILNEKNKELQILDKELKKALPHFKSLYNSKKDKQEITIFRGYEGIKTVLDDILNSKPKEYIVFVGTKVHKYFEPKMKEFNEERIKLKIPLTMILTENENNELLLSSSKTIQNKSKKIDKIKKISSAFQTPAVFNLYGNKTAIILWSKKPLCILIENQEIKNSFIKYFEVLWNLAD